MTTQQAPFVSIVISCHNRSTETEHAIRTLQSQDFSDWELILIDNGSTDTSVAHLTPLAEQDSRIQLTAITRTYVADARNIGISKANPDAKYVMVHDDDDWLFTGALSKLVKKALENPAAVCVYGMAQHCNNNGDATETLETCFGWVRFGVRSNGQIYKLKDIDNDTFESLVVWCSIATMAQVLIRHDVLKQEGGFNKECGISDDWDLWIRLSRVGTFVRIPEFTLHKRMNGSNLSQKRELLRTAERSMRLRLKFNKTLSQSQKKSARMGIFVSNIMHLRWIAEALQHKKYGYAAITLAQVGVRILRGFYLCFVAGPPYVSESPQDMTLGMPTLGRRKP